MMVIMLSIAYLINVATELNPTTVGRGRYAQIISHVQDAVTEGSDGMTRFLQTLWRRRHEFVLERDYPKDYCFANGFLLWYWRLHSFCEKQNM